MILIATYIMEDGNTFELNYSVNSGIVSTDNGMGYQKVCNEGSFLHHIRDAQADGVTNILIKVKDIGS
jgi:hypothetical protein